jgi:hypothetical protein
MGVRDGEPLSKIGTIGIGDDREPPRGVDAEVFGLAFCQGFPGHLVHHLISEADGAPPKGMQGRPHGNHIIIPSGLAIPAQGLSHHQVIPQLLQLEVIEAPLAAIFRSPHLEPDEVIGIVDNPHTIGLRIADPQIKLHAIVTYQTSSLHSTPL